LNTSVFRAGDDDRWQILLSYWYIRSYRPSHTKRLQYSLTYASQIAQFDISWFQNYTMFLGLQIKQGVPGWCPVAVWVLRHCPNTSIMDGVVKLQYLLLKSTLLSFIPHRLQFSFSNTMLYSWKFLKGSFKKYFS
jgi:hypothetical protein